LQRVIALVAEKKGRPVNVDATLIAEEPRITPHVPAMRKRLSVALRLAETNVSIKATTNEGLGTIGRGEGIAAMAVATVEME
jgi:2-C-methyl-D-erythritol 2,4-cyclodiphosphate synthase